MRAGWNPIRRNKNIGTEKSGYGQNNSLTIPLYSIGLLSILVFFSGIVIASGQTPKIKIEPQNDSPLKIYSALIIGDTTTHELEIELINVSNKPIYGYQLNEGGGYSGAIMPTRDKAIKPGQKFKQHGVIETISPPLEEIDLSVDYVEFIDGSSWGKDEDKFSQVLVGYRDGIRLTSTAVLEVLEKGGKEYLLNCIENNSLEVNQPADRSSKWQQGFDWGKRSVVSRVKEDSGKDIKESLKQSFDLIPENEINNSQSNGSPIVIKAVPSIYPALARLARVDGNVTVQVQINANGVVEAAAVLAGHPLLNKFAIEGARRWEFNSIAEKDRIRQITITYCYRMMPDNPKQEELEPVAILPYGYEIRGIAPNTIEY